MKNNLNIIILNDTKRAIGHIGCYKVMDNIALACKKHNLNIIYSFQETDAFKHDIFYEKLNCVDAVLINGEGTFHDDQSTAVDLLLCAMVAKHVFKKPVFLINTVWSNNNLIDRYVDVFDLIFTRESLSQRELSSINVLVKSKVVPDMTFYSGPQSRHKNTNRILITDSVIPEVNNKLVRLSFFNKTLIRVMGDSLSVAPASKMFKLIHKWNLIPFKTLSNEFEIRDAHRIITGRFHTMCIAMIYGVPFKVIPSNTHKVEGTMLDTGLNLELHLVDMTSKMDRKIFNFDFSEEVSNKIFNYVSEAPKKIDDMFHEIKSFILQHTK